MKRVFLWLTSTVLFFSLGADEIFAQPQAGRTEVGAQLTVLSLSPGSSLLSDIDDTLVGGGARLGYYLTDNLSIEGEGTIFKRPGKPFRGRRAQGLFGIKWGKHNESFGVFGKVRPGFMRFDRIFNFVRSELSNTEIKTNYYFALDVGGVIEMYLSKRSIIRFDLGDTIIRYTNRDIEGFDPGALPILKSTYAHNLQFSVGVGFRF